MKLNCCAGVDPDQMLHSAASDLGIHCLLKPAFQAQNAGQSMNMEEILDQKLAELKEKNSEQDLLQHEKVVELARKMHENLNPGDEWELD